MVADSIEKTGAPVRFAIIGCGAVTRLYAAPALARLDSRGLTRVSKAFDPDPRAVESINSFLPSAQPAADLEAALDGADVALIASPPSLHCEQALQALRRGLHVLCEKPMALMSSEAEEMISTANAVSRLVTVSLIRRHLPATRAIKAFLAARILGRLHSISWFEGGPFAWPVSSPRYFSKEVAGGGVLADIGTHALDLLSWWCGPLTVIDYADDAMGGVEANASLHLRAGKADARLRLSRDWGRPSLATIRGELGTIEWTINEPVQFRLSLANGAFSGHVLDEGTDTPTDFVSAYARQLEDLVSAIRTDREPTVPASAGQDVCALVERCYRNRRPLAIPWFSERERARANVVRGAA
jgi:predicted dehydrogenase